MSGTLEHLNVTVTDARKTAAMAMRLFDWHIRWEGPGLGGAGYTMHVGGDDSYVAIYQPNDPATGGGSTYRKTGGLNHIGVTVGDLDAVEERVKAAGFKPINHGDYEPGRRFYFHDHDDVEWEVVSYA